MCMQFSLDKIPSKIFLFTTSLLLLVIAFRKATTSAGPGASLLLSPNHWLLEPCMLAVSAKEPPTSIESIYASSGEKVKMHIYLM